MMKRLFAGMPSLLVTLLLTFPLSMLPGGPRTPEVFTGEVTDTFCAQSGSHHQMMAKMSTMGQDKETCTKKCTQIGAKYVLYNEAQKKLYKLDDQAKAEQFAGKKVQVSGALEGDAIRIVRIEAAG